MTHHEYDRNSYDKYGIRDNFRIVDSQTGARNVGHISPQDAYDLGFSPENNAGFDYHLATLSNPAAVQAIQPGFQDGIVPPDMLKRYIVAVIEFKANGIQKITTKDAKSWNELPVEQVRDIASKLYETYATSDHLKRAFELFNEDLQTVQQQTSTPVLGSIALDSSDLDKN